MVYRFIKVAPGLFRGSAPTPKDVVDLYKNFGIRKIVSLDKDAGERINKVCNILGIKHINIPIDATKPKPLIKLFSYDLYDLLMNDGPTYIHCIHGRDRTGMVIAMFRCKYMGWSCEDATAEAESLGFGMGLDPKITNLYKQLICKSCPKDTNDQNNADIVDNTREHDDFSGSVLDSATMQSFAPYMDGSKWYPASPTYNYNYDQYPTRTNYDLVPVSEYGVGGANGDQIPQIGLYDSNDGVKGVGPVDNGGGFTAT